MSKYSWVALAVLAVALPACADEVTLRNGAVFTGIVREEDDRVIVEIDCGTMTFKRIDVKSVKRSDDPLREYERRIQAASDARGYYEVAVWAREKGLATRANALFQRVISLDPDHEGARQSLGYEKCEGQWLVGDDLMIAKGFARHEGRWLKKEVVEKLLAAEAQLRVEEERRASEERIAQMQRDTELRRLEVEAERIEAEKCRRRDYCPTLGGVLPRYRYVAGGGGPVRIHCATGRTSYAPDPECGRDAPYVLTGPFPVIRP